MAEVYLTRWACYNRPVSLTVISYNLSLRLSYHFPDDFVVTVCDVVESVFGLVVTGVATLDRAVGMA